MDHFLQNRNSPKYTDEELFVSSLEGLRQMDHNKFEHLCGKVLQIKFGGKLTVSPVGADDGVDLVLEKSGENYMKLIVQCKRYKSGRNVKNSDVDRHVAVKDRKRGTRGLFITTSDYTKEAKKVAQQVIHHMDTWDGETFWRIMQKQDWWKVENKRRLVVENSDDTDTFDDDTDSSLFQYCNSDFQPNGCDESDIVNPESRNDRSFSDSRTEYESFPVDNDEPETFDHSIEMQLAECEKKFSTDAEVKTCFLQLLLARYDSIENKKEIERNISMLETQVKDLKHKYETAIEDDEFDKINFLHTEKNKKTEELDAYRNKMRDWESSGTFKLQMKLEKDWYHPRDLLQQIESVKRCLYHKLQKVKEEMKNKGPDGLLSKAKGLKEDLTAIELLHKRAVCIRQIQSNLFYANRQCKKANDLVKLSMQLSKSRLVIKLGMEYKAFQKAVRKLEKKNLKNRSQDGDAEAIKAKADEIYQRADAVLRESTTKISDAEETLKRFEEMGSPAEDLEKVKSWYNELKTMDEKVVSLERQIQNNVFYELPEKEDILDNPVYWETLKEIVGSENVGILRQGSEYTGTLDLRLKGITEEQFKLLAPALKEMKGMEKLDLNGKKDFDGIVYLTPALKEMKGLKELRLYENNIGAEEMESLAEALKEMKGLKSLELCGNHIGDEVAKCLAEALKEMKELKSLTYICDNDIGAEEMQSLAESLIEMQGLKELNLRWNNIGDEGAESLAPALKEMKGLTTLWLDSNNIGDEGAKSLVESLIEMKGMKELNLSENNIGDEGIGYLTPALKEMKGMKELDLSDNNIGDEGAKSLAPALKEMKELKELDLSKNIIEGAKSLAEALKEMKGLGKLGLYDNNIGAEGAKFLAEALKEMKELENLDLQYNKIGDEGAKSLAEALKEMKELKMLNLCSNNIGDEGAASLAESLIEMKELKKLNLCSNNIGDEGAESLAEALFIKKDEGIEGVTFRWHQHW